MRASKSATFGCSHVCQATRRGGSAETEESYGKMALGRPALRVIESRARLSFDDTSAPLRASIAYATGRLPIAVEGRSHRGGCQGDPDTNSSPRPLRRTRRQEKEHKPSFIEAQSPRLSLPMCFDAASRAVTSQTCRPRAHESHRNVHEPPMDAMLRPQDIGDMPVAIDAAPIGPGNSMPRDPQCSTGKLQRNVCHLPGRDVSRGPLRHGLRRRRLDACPIDERR
jgi:hypothetical protein